MARWQDHARDSRAWSSTDDSAGFRLREDNFARVARDSGPRGRAAVTLLTAAFANGIASGRFDVATTLCRPETRGRGGIEVTTSASTATNARPPFLPQHDEYLNARAVPIALAELTGIRSVTGEEATTLLGRKAPVESDGLAIPYVGVTPQYHRIRIDEPEAVGGARYLAPAGVDVPVYLPPPEARAAAPNGPVSLADVLVVVESPIKALAVLAAGINAVGLGGTPTTLEPEKYGVRRLNGSWNRLQLSGRKVIVCFDAGRATNPNVARDEARLVQALSAAGADVAVASLPFGSSGDDQGPDDYIAAHGGAAFYGVLNAAVPADPLERVTTHTAAGKVAADLLDDLPFVHSVLEATPGTVIKVRDAFLRANVGKKDFNNTISAAREAAKRESNPNGPALGDHLDVVDGRICNTVGGAAPLCNFDARIVEERVVDDGVEKQRKLVIAGTLDTGLSLPRVVIDPDDLSDPLWAMKAWGTAAKIASRGGVTDDLRLALQIFSDPVVHTALAHTGWRALTDATGVESGLPVFLHANGAIGAAGVGVELPENLAHYALPSDPVDVVEAVRTSLKLHELGPAQVMFTLLALTYRAPLQSLLPADFSAFFYGKTGSLKTTVALLGAGHFGSGLSEKPVTSFEASTAHIEMVLHRLKDVVALVDDFKPASTHPKDEHQVKARHLFSSIGNQEGRGRMRADGSARPARPPRALVIATGETLPGGESTVARLLPVPLAKQTVNMAKLSKAQANAEALPHAMSAYVHYLRPRLGDLKRDLKHRHAQLRERIRKASEGAHLRSPSALAHVALGLELLASFAVEVGALTAQAAKEFEHEGLKQLESLCTDAKDLARDTDPAQRFLDYLRAKIAQGAFLLNHNLEEPLAKRRGESSILGEWIGWKDGQSFYFLGEPTYSAVVRALPQGEAMPLGEVALWRRLRDQGLTEPGDRVGRLTRRVQLGGSRLDVIVVKKKVLFAEDDGPGGTGGGGGSTSSAGSVGSAGAETDSPDFSEGAATNWTMEGPDRTSSEANCTSAAPGPGGRGSSEVPDTAVVSSDAAVRPGPFGTVGTVRKEEKSREGDFSPDEVEESARVGPPSLSPETGPTVPTGPAAVSDGSPEHFFPAGDSEPKRGLYQPDQRRRTVVADGLAFLRQRPGTEAPIFCLKTARRLLGADGPAASAEFHRHAEVQRELDAAGLAGVAELEFDLLPVLAEMERAGVGVDVAAWAELVKISEAEVAEAQRALADLGLASPEDDASVRDALRARGLTPRSTSWKTLAPYLSDPMVSRLVDFRRAAGFLNSVGRSVLEGARRRSGRVHAAFDPLAAPTGRMSCSKPNLLAIPKAPEYRRCIVPTPGHLFVVADYAAIELRVLANVTRDEALIKIFAEEGDPHAATAAALLKKPVALVTKDERQRAKAVNFGFAFGMGPAKFVEYAFANFGISLAQDEAVQMRTAFLAAYAGVARWQEETRRDMPPVVRTASGRRRVFTSPKAEYTERLNTPVQGTAADGIKQSMVLLHPRLRELDARIVLPVHDELVVEVLPERAAEVRDLVTRTMMEGMARFVRAVPVKVESSIRRNWAEHIET